MDARTRSHQANQIIQALAALPGGTAFDVMARAFPRFGPAEAPSPYSEVSRRFPASQLPDALGLAEAAEEIRITLHGELPHKPVSSELIEKAMGALEELECGRDWEVRAQVAHGGSEVAAYHLTVFTRTAGSPWDA